jgi:hypothetical protein
LSIIGGQARPLRILRPDDSLDMQKHIAYSIYIDPKTNTAAGDGSFVVNPPGLYRIIKTVYSKGRSYEVITEFYRDIIE